MRKKIEWQWEILEENSASAVKRAKVIGGWLIVHQTYINLNTHNKGRMSESMVFVVDRDHEWEIAAPFNPSDPGKLHPQLNPSDFEGSK